MSDEKWVIRRNQLKFSYEHLYRQVAAHFGLSPTVVWILYTLLEHEEGVIQQELGDKWNFPKQTINSAIKNLQAAGHITMTAIPGTKNRKQIRLTDTGRALAENTAGQLLLAEEQAAAQMTEDERTLYLTLSQKYYRALEISTKPLR